MDVEKSKKIEELLKIMFPSYQRPFSQFDFRGYFIWNPEHSKAFCPKFYHACHEDELRDYLKAEALLLRSKWGFLHPYYEQFWLSSGVWCSLNWFVDNYYGPFVLEFPISLLEGKRFMAFYRNEDRNRFFFVQYETDIPLFKKDDKIWRSVDPLGYLSENNEGGYSFREGAIYDLVLTAPLLLSDVSIVSINHLNCIPKKCGGMDSSMSKDRLRNITRDYFMKKAERNPFIQDFLKRFPEVRGLGMPLPSADPVE